MHFVKHQTLSKACRYDQRDASAHTYLNSMWFVMVTFMSIGYGDIVPKTYCGRTLSITTGIVVRHALMYFLKICVIILCT